jgi:hypothetical protein
MGTALGRLLGFYMAEGSTGGGKVNFAFNANEEDFYLCVAKDLMDVFGLSSDLIHNEKCNTKTVSCQSAMLVELFKCGTSKNKKLPEWAWLGGRDFFRGVIHAWLAGDGCERGERGVIRGHTISQDLAYQMHLIAISVGYPASVCRYDSGITSTVIQGRTVNTNPIHYKVSFTADRDESRSSTLIHDDIWHTPVESVEESCYVGDVCNLHVEEDESYVTIGGAAHNCMTLGVPPILIQSYVGLTRATYANYREAVKAFWSETLIPMYTRIEEQLTKELGSEFAGDPAIVFDLSTVDALQESRAEARKFALEAWKTDLLSRDRALRLSSMQEVDGKDVYYSELVKASQPAPAPTEEPDPEVEDETKTFPVAEDDNEGDAEDE